MCVIIIPGIPCTPQQTMNQWICLSIFNEQTETQEREAPRNGGKKENNHLNTCRRQVITLQHNVSQHSSGEKVWGSGANRIIPLEIWWLLSLTYTPRQLNKVLIIQHCLPLASSWWFDLNTWLFLGLQNLTLFFPENLFHGNAFFFRCHLWFCWWSKSPVSCQLKGPCSPKRLFAYVFSFSNTPFVKISVLMGRVFAFDSAHTQDSNFQLREIIFWNTGLAKPFSWMWALKLQYLNTDSPDRYPYISFKNKLKESNKSSKHLIAFGGYFIYSHNIPLDDVLTLFKENRCWSILGIKGFWTRCVVMNSKHHCCKRQLGFTYMSYLVYFTPKNISHSYTKNVEQYLNF